VGEFCSSGDDPLLLLTNIKGAFPLAGVGVAMAEGDEGLVVAIVTFRTVGEEVEEVEGRNRGRKEDT
jgi:hypothetical protein